MLAREGKGVVQSVCKEDLIEPWGPIAKIDDATIEKHPPHANEGDIEHRLDFFGLRLVPYAPLLNRSGVVQAKVFDVGWNEPDFAHGAYDFVECGNVSAGEDVFQCPGVAGHGPLFSDGVEQPYTAALQD